MSVAADSAVTEHPANMSESMKMVEASRTDFGGMLFESKAAYM